MTDKELKLGMVVRGHNKVMTDTDEITEIWMSRGSRKDLLYRIGINSYFADQIDIDWYCIFKTIGQGNTYELKTPFKLTCGGKKVVVTKVDLQDKFEIIGDGFRYPLYNLCKLTAKRLYWQILEELGI